MSSLTFLGKPLVINPREMSLSASHSTNSEKCGHKLGCPPPERIKKLKKQLTQVSEKMNYKNDLFNLISIKTRPRVWT